MSRELTPEQVSKVDHDEAIKRGRVRPVQRGKKRTARNLSLSMSAFWQLPAPEQRILHEISRRGRR